MSRWWTLLGLLLSPLARGGEVGSTSAEVHGAWSFHPDTFSPVPMGDAAGPPTRNVLGCGGLGFVMKPQDRVRGRRGRVRYKAAHGRYIARVAEFCMDAPSPFRETTQSFSMLHLGYGGQWGGRSVYVAASAEAGPSFFLRSLGGASATMAGIGTRSRAALGLQLGVVNLEVGPTVRAAVPLLINLHNADLVKGVPASVALDVSVAFGEGTGPWRPGR